MFMTKSNSKQKRVKNTQERETGILPLSSSLGEHYYSLWQETASTRQAGKTFALASWDLLVRRPKTLDVGSWELLVRRPRTLARRAMTTTRQVRFEHSSWRAMTDRSANKPLFLLKTLILTTPNPKIDMEQYLLISTTQTSLPYINSWNYLHFQQFLLILDLIPIISKPNNNYNNYMIRPFTESYA